MNLKKIFFSNYGYKKNEINGEIFEKKFKVNILNNFKKINFKLLSTGIFVSLNILESNEGSKLNGSLKAKLLKSSLKSDFIFDGKSLYLNDLVLRQKFIFQQ